LILTAIDSGETSAKSLGALAVDREVGDEAVLAIGAFRGRVANVQHGRGDGLALAGFLEDGIGVAVHQPVDRSEIPDFIASGRGLRRELHLSRGELRRHRRQTEQAEQKRAHGNPRESRIGG
jgi:hypothetical protein